jgi:dTDP-4-dehydrorhamnose reductase
MKIAVLGGNGMLGSMLVRHLSKSMDIVATVRSLDKVTHNPNVDWRLFDYPQHKEEELKEITTGCAWVINAIGAIPQRWRGQKMMVEANICLPYLLLSLKQTVIQIGTDCVYSGSHYTGISENDSPDPIDRYGYSKVLGEFGQSKILRCSIVGPETHGESLLGWFLNQPAGAQIKGFSNHHWNGVTTLVFAKICQGIIQNNVKLSRIQHIVPADWANKYYLLKLFAEYYGRLDIELTPTQVPTSISRVLKTLYPNLNKQLWELAGYSEIPTIRQMVKEMAEYG